MLSFTYSQLLLKCAPAADDDSRKIQFPIRNTIVVVQQNQILPYPQNCLGKCSTHRAQPGYLFRSLETSPDLVADPPLTGFDPPIQAASHSVLLPLASFSCFASSADSPSASWSTATAVQPALQAAASTARSAATAVRPLPLTAVDTPPRSASSALSQSRRSVRIGSPTAACRRTASEISSAVRPALTMLSPSTR